MIESVFGHVKVEYQHLLAIRDPAVLRAELAVVHNHYNGVWLHAGIGYVTPNDEHEAAANRSARPARPDSSRPGCGGLHGTASAVSLNRPRSPAVLAN
jgi:putative transposase